MLAPLVAARPGLRVPGAWDGFELAVRAIFGQQITVPAATRLLGRLVDAHGTRLPAAAKDGEGLSHLFPSPARLASADLAVLGMPMAQAEVGVTDADVLFGQSAALAGPARALPAFGIHSSPRPHPAGTFPIQP